MVRDLLLVALAACATMLPGLGQTRQLAPRELRHAEIAREMAASGDFVVPTLLGETYRDKPPVLHAAAAVLFRAAGGPSIGLARLPSAISAILSVLALYGLGRILTDRRTALLAAIGLACAQGFVRMGQQARPDMILGLAVTAGCLGFAWAMTASTARSRILAGVLAGAAIGLGTLTKGPYGILFPVLFAVLAPIGVPRLRRPRLATWAALLPVFLAVLAIWAVPAWRRDGGGYLGTVLIQPDLVSGSGHHARPFYWYLGPLLPSFLPLTLFLPALAGRVRRAGPGPLLLPVAAILLVLSAVPGKRVHYLVPLYPLLALATVEALLLVARSRPRLRRALVVVLAIALPLPAAYNLIAIPMRSPPLSEDIAFATTVMQATGPNADIVCSSGLGEPLSWVFQRSDIREIRSPGGIPTALTRRADPIWLAVEGPRPRLLASFRTRYSVVPFPVSAPTGTEPRDYGSLYLLLPLK